MKVPPRLLLATVILGLIGAWLFFDLGRFFSIDYLKSQQVALETWRAANPVLAIAAMVVTYIFVTALSLPGAALMTLAAGAIFGLWTGLAIASFSAAIGATLAFLSARYLLKDWVLSKFSGKMESINNGIEKDGAFYLFTLRLVPIFPFFIINLVMALTPMKTWTFYWVSQIGMLAGGFVFVNAGTHLAQIDSIKGILSPELLFSFALLGIFPFIAKKIIEWVQSRKVYAIWKKPKSFDRNLIVIGGGAAGLVSAYIAAAVKAKVTLVEKHKMGGDCLNTGCVPSKTLIRSTKLLAQMRRAEEFGLQKIEGEFEFSSLMQRVKRVIKKIEPHDSAPRYTKLGVDVIEGEATITSPWTVDIQHDNKTEKLTTKNIIIATGAKPTVPPIPGLQEIGYLTSDTVWDLTEQPKRLIILGGGPIGCELAQSFARLGTKVTLLEMLPRLMIREDEEISAMVKTRFQTEGIAVLTKHKALRCMIENGDKILVSEDLTDASTERHFSFDQLLIAVGRTANTTGFGLEKLGIPNNQQGCIETNDYLQTKYPNIYACGDVAGPFQFTHTAAHQAWYSAVNALFSPFKKFRADYSVIPWATFVDPEVARVGINEQEAKEKGIGYEISTYGIEDLDRAIADEAAEGLIKVLTVPGKDKILGVTIIGEHASDTIAEFVMAMRHGIGLNKMLGTIHIYPTFSEANKYVAGNWKRAHAPEKTLKLVEKFHRWRRG